MTLLLLYTYAMSRSKEGYYLKAIGTNEMAAGTLGINVFAYKMRAQFRTAFLMAMGGGIYGMYIIYMDPQTIFSFQMSFQIILVCVFGGRGTVFGPTIGALILMPIYEILRMEFSMMLPGLPTALFGLTLMAVSYTHLDVYKRQASYTGCDSAEDRQGLCGAWIFYRQQRWPGCSGDYWHR